MAEDFKAAHPRGFFQQYLLQGLRPDGRSLHEFRKVLINSGSISTAEGSSLIKLGSTMVVCGIKAELCAPSPLNPSKGWVVPNVEISPICSSEFRPGRPSDKAQVLSQFVFDTIRNSDMLSLEELCIFESKVAWVLYIDIFCASHDGNLTDALLIAVLAALQNTILPVVVIDPATETVHVSKTENRRLNIYSKPVSATFSLFDELSTLADPTHEEEDLSKGTLTVVIGNDDKLCSVYKPGGLSLREDALQSCILTAALRAKAIRELVDKAADGMDC